MRPAAKDTPPPDQSPKSHGPQVVAQQRSRACSHTLQQRRRPLAALPRSKGARQQHEQQAPAAVAAGAVAEAAAAAAGVRLTSVLPTLWLPALHKLQQVHASVMQAAEDSLVRATLLQHQLPSAPPQQQGPGSTGPPCRLRVNLAASSCSNCHSTAACLTHTWALVMHQLRRERTRLCSSSSSRGLVSDSKGVQGREVHRGQRHLAGQQ